MIIGNPYKFSIFVETIKEWNLDGTFCNGILLFSINGILFPKEIITATLKSEIPPLKEKLSNIIVDEELYNMSKEKVFIEIYHKIFPEDININNDYRFDITPSSLSDNGYFIFAVSNGIYARILADELKYIRKESCHDLSVINVKEAFIAISELNEMALELDIRQV